MSKYPKLAIVGRPNVGKSALFNRICKKKIAIVDEAEGVTRDRLYANAEIFGLHFEVIDTGGIDQRSQAQFNDHIKQQAEIAIEEADTIIMIVDAHVGVTTLDKEVAQILLRTKKPLCLAVNKVDNLSQMDLVYPFYCLGISKIVAVSAAQGWHIAEMLEMAFEGFKKPEEEEIDPSLINLAVIGRPNVGKSSLINYLLDEERCIVSPIPGTTRDSIDIKFKVGDKTYNLIDTAGIKRKHAEHDVVEKFAAIRTERAIERADICLLMLDSQNGMSAQEKKIANQIEEAGKGCILLLNKWDLVKGFRMEHCLKEIEDEAAFLKHCPKIFMSAKTGRNIDKIFETVSLVSEESKKRITTHQLNKFIGAALQKTHPPMLKGKRLRIYYMAQVAVQPPVFILFVNNIHLMTETYKKYIYNQFRETYQFSGVPIQIHLKGKERKDYEDHLSLRKKHPASKDHAEEHKEFEDDDFIDDGNFDDGDEEFLESEQ